VVDEEEFCLLEFTLTIKNYKKEAEEKQLICI
jgi:hypothetical protein